MSAWTSSEIADVCEDLRKARENNDKLTSDYNKLVGEYNDLLAKAKKDRAVVSDNNRKINDAVASMRAYIRTVTASGKLSAADEARGRELMRVAGELMDKLSSMIV